MYFLRVKNHLINIITAAKSAYSKFLKLYDKNLDFQLEHCITSVVIFYVCVTFLNVQLTFQMSRWLMALINFYTEQCGVRIYSHNWWNKAGHITPVSIILYCLFTIWTQVFKKTKGTSVQLPKTVSSIFCHDNETVHVICNLSIVSSVTEPSKNTDTEQSGSGI